MINTTKIDKIKEKAHLPPFQKQNKGLFVFPITIAGTLDNTNTGQLPNGNNKADIYNYFERIFVGDRPIWLYWEDSISGVSQKEDITLNNGTTPINETTHQLFTMKVGTTLSGMFVDENEGADIDDEQTFQDYKVLRVNQKITLRFEPSTMNVWDQELEPTYGFQWDINSYFKLYLIEGYGKNFFRLLNATPLKDVRDNSKIISWECEFEYTGNTLQKTGQAYENYLQHGYFIGGAYAYPKIVYDENNNKKVVLDKDFLKHGGVSHVKVEKLGNACISSLTFLGNEVLEEDGVKWGGITQPKATETDDNGNITQATFKFYNSKHIFPNHIFQTSSNSLYRRQAPTSNFNVMFQSYLSLTADYDKWKEEIPNKLKSNTKYSWEGTINHTEYNSSGILQFNPYSLTAYDPDNNFTYWQKGSFKLSDNTPTGSDTYSYILSPPALGGTLSLGQLPNKDNFTYSLFNLINYYIGNEIVSLPLSQNVNLTSYVKDWPILGGLFNKILSGVQLGINSTENMEEYDYNTHKLPNFLIDSEAYAFGNMIYTTTTSKFPAEILKYGDDNKNTQDVFSLYSQVNVSYICNLSDIIQFNTTDETKMFRDSFTLETNFDVDPKTPNNLYLENKDRELYKLQNVKDITETELLGHRPGYSEKRYVIVGAENFDLFNGVVKLTTYSNDSYYVVGITESSMNSNFTYSLMTNANWRNSLREWKTEIQLNALPWIPQAGEQVYFPNNVIGDGRQGGEVWSATIQPFNGEKNPTSNSNLKYTITNVINKPANFPISTSVCALFAPDFYYNKDNSITDTISTTIQYNVITNITLNSGETLKQAILRQLGGNSLVIANTNRNDNKLQYRESYGNNDWKTTPINNFMTNFNGITFSINDIITKMGNGNSCVYNLEVGKDFDEFIPLGDFVIVSYVGSGSTGTKRNRHTLYTWIHSCNITFSLDENTNSLNCVVVISWINIATTDHTRDDIVDSHDLNIYNNERVFDNMTTIKYETGNTTKYTISWNNFLII